MICGATSPNERFFNHAKNGKERHGSKCPRYHGNGTVTFTWRDGSGVEVEVLEIATKCPRYHGRRESECSRCGGGVSA